MSVRDFMAGVDARIYASPIVRAVMTFGTNRVIGAFFLESREIQFPDGSIMGIAISFECRWVPALALLSAQDEVSVDDYGSFRFMRELQPGGDESGKTVIELGEFL
jgi:hypothetical protein